MLKLNIQLTNIMNNPASLSAMQLYAMVALRVLTGWYFLYQGIVKLLNPAWSALAFLKSTEGILSPAFQVLADNPMGLELVNFLNVWGLIAIGLGLITGTLARAASLSGALLVFLYYLAHPPTIEAQLMPGAEQALWVDKNLIFAMLLLVLYTLPTSHIIGLDRLIFNKSNTHGR